MPVTKYLPNIKLLKPIKLLNYYLNKSQGFKPVCFLNAAEKCEMEE